MLPWASLNVLVLAMGHLPPGDQPPLLEIIRSAAGLPGQWFLLESPGSPGQSTVLSVRPTLQGRYFVSLPSPPIFPPRASAPQSLTAPLSMY